MSLLTAKNALITFRLARTLPVVPLVIGAVALAGCAKVVSDVRKDRPLATLEGSEWGYENSDQFVAFKSKGEVIGNGGCNNFFGNYTQTEGALTFGPLASTRKFCQGKMKAEQDFMNSIQNSRRFEATHKVINLLDENNQTLLTLQRRDWD